MEPEIITKLGTLLRKGITTEAEAVYLLVELRKLLEQQQAKKKYKYLTFHCDWTMHSKLEGPAAQDVLNKFDAANLQLKRGMELRDLPAELKKDVDNISQLKLFEKELGEFLRDNRLPGMKAARADGWIHFMHLYASVVADCPLVISEKNAAAGIESVTVSFELAKQSTGNEMPFKVGWKVLDKNGKTGEIFVINSFSLQ